MGFSPRTGGTQSQVWSEGMRARNQVTKRQDIGGCGWTMKPGLQGGGVRAGRKESCRRKESMYRTQRETAVPAPSSTPASVSWWPASKNAGTRAEAKRRLRPSPPLHLSYWHKRPMTGACSPIVLSACQTFTRQM